MMHHLFRPADLLALFGVAALAASVWLFGPALVGWGVPLASATSRLITITAIVALYILLKVGHGLLRYRKNRQLVKDLAQSDDDPAAQTAAELAELRSKFKEAMAVLRRTSSSQGGSAYLYELPWYVIIGPPGAGKTTALLNSGLEFPLKRQIGNAQVQGIAGTRNCEWWFTDYAVLLDTAGRYTTQDSHREVDARAWSGFLGLLKKHRRRCPLNGVIVAFSLQDLLEITPEERHDHASRVRQRIVELQRELGIRLPVYMMFTKMDLLAGFMEFFNDLNREDRAQVWGMTFPLATDGVAPLAHFDEEFALLQRELYHRLIHRLHGERDLIQRDLIYTFPQQFATLRESSRDFLTQIFQPQGRLDGIALLRGVYFSSGTQEGSPIDRTMMAMAKTFGLRPQSLTGMSGQGKSYFLTRLLRDVIFRETNLAGGHWQRQRRQIALRWTALSGLILATVGLTGYLLYDYQHSSSDIRQISTRLSLLNHQVDSMSAGDTNPLSALPALELAREIVERYRAMPLIQAVNHSAEGEDEGVVAVDAAEQTYRQLLEQALLPRLLLQLEQRLEQLLQMRPNRELDSALAQDQYWQNLRSALRAYRLFGDPQQLRLRPALVSQWFDHYWAQSRFASEQIAALQDHLQVLLQRPPTVLPLSLDEELIRAVEQRLSASGAPVASLPPRPLTNLGG